MATNRKIQTALVSVYHKDGLEPLLRALHRQGVQFLSTGGTHDFICSLGLPCERVEDLTGYPSILGGRVKTLHPKVFGGILGRRDLSDDVQQMAQYEIGNIDLVIVDLYPFEATVASGASAAEIIEKIDIGGISLIRAAAKNFNDVVIVSSKTDYARCSNRRSPRRRNHTRGASRLRHPRFRHLLALRHGHSRLVRTGLTPLGNIFPQAIFPIAPPSNHRIAQWEFFLPSSR